MIIKKYLNNIVFTDLVFIFVVLTPTKMSKEEIVKGNRIIAEFMGLKFSQRKKVKEHNYGEINWDVWSPDGIKKGATWTEMGDQLIEDVVSKCHFHTSWDWLMPVVEKIANVTIKGVAPFNSDQLVRFEIVSGGYVKISNLRDTPLVTYVSKEGSLILAVYSAVLQFINWYNTAKLSK